MRLFCMDLHISVIADFKSANPDIEVVDWCLSGHAWVMKRKQDVPEHIHPHSWRDLNMDMIQKFQQTYDSFLRQFDGFIVCHVPAFAMIYEKYNRPILWINSCRYDIPFCWNKRMDMLQEYHNCLHRLHTKGLLTIISNNLADQAYTCAGTGIQPQYIPSLCLYTKSQYTPTKPTFLCYNGTFGDHPLLTYKKQLPQPYEWKDITSFRGIINDPYEVSLMSCFEQFTAGCPMFFPSKSYWKSNCNIQSMYAYWGKTRPDYLKQFDDLSWWIDHADMYSVFQSPNTYYYDSKEHLFELLHNFEYVDDREFRRNHIQSVQTKWKEVLLKIKAHKFWTQLPQHLCYNRVPLLADTVYDIQYVGTGVTAQHTYPMKSNPDIIFVKTDLLQQFLDRIPIQKPITLVTGVSDLSPTESQSQRILNNPNITRWIGCNIPISHPKIRKLLIGVGEPERANGNHEILLKLHSQRINWDSKQSSICIPFHSQTHISRNIHPTLPKLPYEDYMREISKHKFVICMRGNGLDTHRFSEILLMGSVPITEHSGLDDLYSQFPCILVDSYDSIDVSSFVWDESKYQHFLDMFWLRNGLKKYLFK